MIEFAEIMPLNPCPVTEMTVQKKVDARSSKKLVFVFLVLLFLAGLVIRTVGLDYGKPLLVHPDEENIVKSALRFTPATGFEEVAYNRPAQIQITLNAISLRLYSQVRFHEPMYMVYYSREFDLYLAARFLTAVLGALIPLVAFFIGKELKPDFSVPAAIIFCLFPSFIQHSHYVTPDVPITLWTMLVLLFAMRYACGKSQLNLWLAVLFTVVNTADKYPGILSSLIVFGALILRFKAEAKLAGRFDGKRFVLKTLASLVAFFGFLFLVAPNLYFHYSEVFSAIVHEANPAHLGADGLAYPQMLLKYGEYFISNANLILIALVVIGAVGLARSKQPAGWLFYYGLVYCLLLNFTGKYFERWALPMYTTPLLLASYGVTWLLNVLKGKKLASRALKSALLVGVGLLLLAGVGESLLLALPDTRGAALTYLEANGISEAKSYYDGFSPFSPRDYPLTRKLSPEISQKYDYAILSSYHYQLYFDNPLRSAEPIKIYEQLRREGEIVKEFTPLPAPRTVRSQWLLLRNALFGQQALPLYTGPNIQIIQFKN